MPEDLEKSKYEKYIPSGSRGAECLLAVVWLGPVDLISLQDGKVNRAHLKFCDYCE